MSDAIVWSNQSRPDKVWTSGINYYIDDVNNAVGMLLLSFAPRIEAHMKLEAPWTDRTGNARQSLAAEARSKGDVHTLEFGFSNSIEYAELLEFMREGKFAIVGPTLDLFGEQIFAELRALFV